MEVALVDFMGDDIRVVNAARVSFNKESEWEEIEGFVGPVFEGKWEIVGKELSESDQKLIRYLAKNNHWTPFSHVMITMREKVPVFVARQRFKHMVGFTYNEVSRRYVDDKPEFFAPDIWRSRPDKSIKQGSGGKHEDQEGNNWLYKKALDMCKDVYEGLIEKGVAPEQARMVLPQAMYTEYYCTGSLSAWARAYKLRIDSHAQKEIRDLAEIWGQIIGNIPELEHSWKALTA